MRVGVVVAAYVVGAEPQEWGCDGSSQCSYSLSIYPTYYYLIYYIGFAIGYKKACFGISRHVYPGPDRFGAFFRKWRQIREIPRN